MTKHIFVDTETFGPYPPRYSMIQLAAVCYEDQDQVFYRNIRPLTNAIVDEGTIPIHKISPEQAEEFDHPAVVMRDFHEWLLSLRDQPNERLIMVADNASFDFTWVQYYLHEFAGECVLGWSCMSLTWLVKGFGRTNRARKSQLQTLPHTHDALDDVRANITVMDALIEKGYDLYGKHR